MEHVRQLWDPVFHQAVGMVSVQLKTTVEAAELRILSEAGREGVSTDVIARQITDRTRRFSR